MNMCLTIADQGEGQSPKRLPHTILSLNDRNKQRIRFVQGKFNMGGSGALRFCGKCGLQLVITKRHPELANKERTHDITVDEWAITIVRREEPSNISGEPIHSEFTYLAPIDAKEKPRNGEVLKFKSDTLKLMPHQDEPYYREIEYGAAIKLYEYETHVGQSNIIWPDGLMYALERLMPEIPLPVRLHECRGYKGEKERSFETPIAGLVVRLEDGKGDNLESGFPLSVRLHAAGMNMSAKIYAFKEDKAATYLKDEGVIFAMNGQAHGYLPKSIFSRPKSVGLPRLKDSLLVILDCSSLGPIQREDLFMSSRDRLSKKTIRYEVEHEIELMLRENPELKKLQQYRREQDVELKLSEERPLEEVIGKVLRASPTLKTIFLLGQRLARPFTNETGRKNGNEDGSGKGESVFKGKRHPTYFKIKGRPYGEIYSRNCEKRCLIVFETDVENDYFDRTLDRGNFYLEILESSKELSSPNYSLSIANGIVFLNLELPKETEVNDWLAIQTTVNDPTLLEPFVNIIKLNVTPKPIRPTRPPRPSRPPKPGRGKGKEGQNIPSGISLPKVVPVKQDDKSWIRYNFTAETASHVISDPIESADGKKRFEHVFYINMDNNSLRTEMKYSKQHPRLLEAKFKYGNVLLGLAMLHQSDKSNELNPKEDDEEQQTNTIQDRIRQVSEAVAPVLLPMIDQLAGLDEDDIETISSAGEDE
jgi:hypothetical protein